MLRTTDIHSLAYSDELISAGISYVMDAVSLSKTKTKITEFDILREWVSEKAVELAFRRYLVEQEVPHQLLKIPSFGEDEKHVIQLGGRRCKIFNLLISQRKDIKAIHSNSERILSAKALVPQSYSQQEGANEDLLLFTAMTGLVTRSLGDLKKSVDAAQPIHLIYQFPQAWAQPSEWKALGPLALKGDTVQDHSLVLTGQDEQHAFLKTKLSLPIKERKVIEEDFYSLGQIQIENLPAGPVGIHSPGLHYTLLIAPYQWGNLWVYGLKIFLIGFQSYRKFFESAKPIPVGSSVLGNPNISQDCLGVPMDTLRPISDLFGRARDWAAR